MGLGGWLTVLFVGLKLTHCIDWSWWWVLSPLWITAGFVLAFMLILLLIMIVAAIAGK
jgi:hypothetical protein